jgi:hypothetical protein
LEKLIEANTEKLREKDEVISRLKSEIKTDKSNQLHRKQQQELQDELNFYS